MTDRKGLILGAAVAVIHEVKLGEISRDRAGGWYDENNKKWRNFDSISNCIQKGVSPDSSIVPVVVKDALAFLQQSMRIDYDEWFAIFPWCESDASL